MRRNLRLDWRALALLGALLTIMIKWPGEAGGKGLVHAMPTNSNREQLTEPTTIMTLLQMNRNVSAYHNNVDIKAKDRQYNELVLLPAINVESTTEYDEDETTSTTTPITTNNQLKQQTNINEKNQNIVGFKIVTNGYNASHISTNYTNEFQHKNNQLNNLTTTLETKKNSEDEKKVEYSISHNSNNNKQLIDKFKFISSHHIAAVILSRTERSVVVDNGNSNIVRRSPDITHNSNNFVGGLKSRRLNISRNNHNNINSNHNNSNNNNSLDRNERSTISHLSGPSRKIQLFIKNRYLQLLPDGTINGTQNEYSEYSK